MQAVKQGKAAREDAFALIGEVFRMGFSPGEAKDLLCGVWLQQMGKREGVGPEGATLEWMKAIPAKDLGECSKVRQASVSGEWDEVRRIAGDTRSEFVEKYAALQIIGAGKAVELGRLENVLAGKRRKKG